MDKNIAAFLDTTAYTVSVVFPKESGSANKSYTYICNIPGVEVGDWVIVDAPNFDGTAAYKTATLNGIPKLVLVTGVDDAVCIEPDATHQYGWVVSVLDTTEYAATTKRNSQITDLVADAYKAAMRKSFAERILGDMPEVSKTTLLALLHK